MRIHARVIVLAAALILGGLPAAAADRALLIGAGAYQDDNLSDLYGPPRDVERMRQLLIGDLGYGADAIHTLTEAAATRSNIVAAIEQWLIGGTGPGDRVFLYFSGHGAAVQIPDGDGVRLTTGLVPIDADVTVDPTATHAGGLLLGAQLGDLVRKMRGREVTIVVDACHSGSLTRGLDGGPTKVGIRTITPNGPVRLAESDITAELIAQNKTDLRLFDFNARGGEPMEGVAVWSAATMSQYSWEDSGGGVFTNAVIGGIRNREAAYTGDGRVTASSLLAHVREVTGEWCRNHPDCTLGFTPELLATDEYRAEVIVPWAPVADEADAPDVPAEDEPADEPTGPELVDLAEGVFNHTNDFGLEASIIPGIEVDLGDTVKFRILSEETGQLLVLDTGPDGKLRRIFPNEYSEAAGREGRVRAGNALTIPDESYPFEFTATDAGPGTLMVLVAEPGTDFGQLLDSADFEVAENAGKALIAIAAQLQEPVLDPDPETDNRARRWAFVTVPYRVGR